MSFLKVRKKGKYNRNIRSKSRSASPGRPVGSILKKPEQKSTIPMRISPELYELIEPELRKNETYSETILRLLKESRWAHINEAKKGRALLEVLSSVPDAERYISIANERALAYEISR